jgi:diaminohydroxyphosphoribosylaminopyrimidine deaminase/5-amino-6-(5-phosphoribosylamino)uracil reductase
MFSAEDALFLQRCLQLASLAGAEAQPNPMVGCVIVHKGEIIGEGYHHGPGLPHAEPEALRSVQAKERLIDATLYVNLEPCNHFGRTPPCTDAILKSGIQRVVVGMRDPHPLVAGTGIQRLQQAGIEVVIAPDEKMYRQFNKVFLHAISKSTPWCTLKWAQDAAGHMGERNHRIQISDIATAPFVHRLRAAHQAILVGANTMIIDQPHLGTRFFPGPQPLRIVLDPEGRVPLACFDALPAASWIWLVRHPISVAQTQVPEHLFEDLPSLMTWLHTTLHIQSILIEGGQWVLQKCIQQKVGQSIIRIKSTRNLNLADPVIAPDFPVYNDNRMVEFISGQDIVQVVEVQV